MPKKTPAARLDREIAEALRRKPSSSRAKHPPVRRAHATVSKNGKQQADVLMVANDAALSDQYARAEKLLSQGKQRAIATSYSTTTPESATEGDFADRGWVDKDGDPIEVDADEIASEHESGSQAPVTDAIVEKAVKWLRDAGAYEASSASHESGGWYSSSWETSDFGTGEERSEDFFLRNFTEAEEKKIFESFKRGRR